MASWGSADYKQLKKLRDRLNQLNSAEFDKFCEACCKELAARLLALVIPKTPVGKYPPGSGKKGGTLRRGWGAKSAKEASSYAQSLHVSKHGNSYTVEIINPIEYASYVEYGHRTRGGAGWVPGRYMLTISEEKLSQMTPAILEQKLQAKLKEVFNV